MLVHWCLACHYICRRYCICQTIVSDIVIVQTATSIIDICSISTFVRDIFTVNHLLAILLVVEKKTKDIKNATMDTIDRGLVSINLNIVGVMEWKHASGLKTN